MFWTIGGVIGITFLAQLFIVPEICELLYIMQYDYVTEYKL